ncbi:MAG: FimV/HubP family polar landmark protein [Dyella sp.]
MNRSLKLSAMLALVLGSSQALAGVGQIQVKSALGQPLLADIPLQPDSPAELRNLSATLASSEDFARAGISGRPTVPLQFSVVNGADGGKLIRVTSTQAINSPYLDLLVQMTSAAGTSLREFAVLLDPPGMASPPEVAAPVAPAAAASPPPTPPAASAPAQPSQATPRAQPQAQPQPQPLAAQRAQRQAPVAASSASHGNSDRYGPVRRGDTLSSIARQRASSGGNTEQILLALKQANPEAFFRDNINALKTGAVLRMPSAEQLAAVSEADAAAEVRRQNQAWRGGSAQVPATTVVADAATRPSASTAPSAKPSPEDRLALVPAKTSSQAARSSAGNAAASAASAAGLAALQQQQAQLQEALSTLQQQGGELRSRVKDLEDINAKNARLLALKDNEIADLQRRLAEAQKSAGQPAPPAATAKGDIPGAAPASSSPRAAVPSEAAAATARTAPTPATPGSRAATVPAPASAPGATPKTGTVVKSAPAAPLADDPWFTKPWAWLVGAVIVLLLLLVRSSRRRRAAQMAVPVAVGGSLAEHFVDGPVAQPEAAIYDTDLHQLQDQLAEHPDDVGLRLELISLYYDRRDVEHFEAEAEAMYAHIGNPQQEEWQDVVAMGRDLAPGHPLFAEPSAATHEQEHTPVPVAHEPPAPFSFDEPHYNLTAAPSLSTQAPSLDEPDADTWDELPGDLESAVPWAEESASLEPASSTLPEAEPASGEVSHASTPSLPDQEPLSSHRWQFDEPLMDEPLSTDAAPTPPSPREFSLEELDLSLDEGLTRDHDDVSDGALSHFSDDPVDTKLDLARAYLDMGDADGARSMLDEVLSEGSQMQQDMARKLLAEMH